MERSCPLCLKVTDRLIKEICGHFKCRNCFIEEETGCRECRNKSENDMYGKTKGSELPTENIHYGIGIEQGVIHSKNKTSFPVSKHAEKIPILENIVIRQPVNSAMLNEGHKPETRKLYKKIPGHIIKLICDSGISYECLICNKTFYSRSQQYYHLYCNELHKKPFFCAICFKRFSSSYHLKYHEETHKDIKKRECPKCGKIFTRAITFEKHMKNHEQDIKYRCSKCSAVFKDKYAFRGHCEKHDNIYPYSCQFCEKGFSLKSNFKQHQIVHCGKTSYECLECKKRFKRKSTFKVHSMLHSERKRLTCSICEKTFTDTKSLHRHNKTHDDSAFYKCLFCPVKSKRKDNLSRHVRNMHPEAKSASTIRETNSEMETNSSKRMTSEEHENMKYHVDKNTPQNNCPSIKAVETDQIQTCSVIKSIGNVKPVIIAKNYDYKNTKSIVNTQTDEVINNNSSSLSKKRKKKYDPSEIYRKILFASNDDDSVLEEADENLDAVVSGANEKIFEQSFESNAQLNFAEIHWRKRTSQYFSSINT